LPEESLPEDDLDVPAVDSTCPEGRSHTIQQGETAADVQLRHNVNRYTLEQANPAADLDSLTAGQVLCIPAENKTCPVRQTYVLGEDETLESVALRLNTSLSVLLRHNPCLAPSDFTAGACIWIPQ